MTPGPSSKISAQRASLSAPVSAGKSSRIDETRDFRSFCPSMAEDGPGASSSPDKAVRARATDNFLFIVFLLAASLKVPRSPHGLAREPVGGFVAGKDLPLRVETQGTAELDGDLGQIDEGAGPVA